MRTVRRARTTRAPRFGRWLERAKESGAESAKIIRPDSVVTAAWVRLKCQYGCGGWGGCLTCPPHSPTPQQTRAVLDCYKTALLVHGGDHVDLSKTVAALEREIFLAGYYKALAFGCGPCRLCRECNLDDCAHPREARPSMEAAGIDVYATARGNGYPLEVVKDHSCPTNYYGLVLIE